MRMSEEEKDGLEDTLERMSLSVFRAGSNVPPAAQTVIALRAFGMSPPEIARRLGYKDSGGVRKLLYRYDPNKVAESGDMVRRLALSAMFERVAFEVLSTLKPKEIQELPVDKRIDVAMKAAKAMNMIQASPIELTKNEERLLAELKGEIIEAEFTEDT